MKIIAISGSIRKDSYNSALVRAVSKHALKNMEVEVFDISTIPFFNQDIEDPMPESVRELKTKIQNADGVIVSTPEYGGMIPGILKNTFEWLSRGDEIGKVMHDKPMAIMGATSGGFGAVKALNQLLMVGTVLRAKVHVDLSLPVSHVDKLVDIHGEIVEEGILSKINALLEYLQVFVYDK